MHELGIMRQAVQLAISAAESEQAAKVTRIKLEIGALAGVAPSALNFAFDCVVNGTIAEGAYFEWSEIPVQCRCENGCPPFHPQDAIYRCPICEVISTDVIAGRELQVVEIDVEP